MRLNRTRLIGLVAALVLLLVLAAGGLAWHHRHHQQSVRKPIDLSTLVPAKDAITNGRQITADNTGVGAWRGPNGERCTDPKVYTGTVHVSSLGNSVDCAWFKGEVVFDRPITITASRFDNAIDTGGQTVHLDYDTIATTEVEDICVHGDGTYVLLRSQVGGCTDAVRFDDDVIVESLLTTKAAGAEDHNDGVQAYQADAGGVILRSNIDARPVNGAQFGISVGDGAIFLADDSQGTTEIRDNYLQGGGYTLRLNEAQHYRVTGNVIATKGSGADVYLYGPVDTTNSVAGAFLEWSDNMLSDGAALPKPS